MPTFSFEYQVWVQKSLLFSYVNSTKAQQYSLLGYIGAYFVDSPMLRRNTMPPSSGPASTRKSTRKKSRRRPQDKFHGKPSDTYYGGARFEPLSRHRET
jgi:hypothetical protein